MKQTLHKQKGAAGWILLNRGGPVADVSLVDGKPVVDETTTVGDDGWMVSCIEELRGSGVSEVTLYASLLAHMRGRLWAGEISG